MLDSNTNIVSRSHYNTATYTPANLDRLSKIYNLVHKAKEKMQKPIALNLLVTYEAISSFNSIEPLTRGLRATLKTCGWAWVKEFSNNTYYAHLLIVLDKHLEQDYVINLLQSTLENTQGVLAVNIIKTAKDKPFYYLKTHSSECCTRFCIQSDLDNRSSIKHKEFGSSTKLVTSNNKQHQ